MYKNVLEKMRRCVQQRMYETTLHADEQLDEDDLAPDDAKRAILNGRIIKRQWDNEAGEYKYLIQGTAVIGSEIVVVAKIDEKGWAVVITVYKV